MNSTSRGPEPDANASGGGRSFDRYAKTYGGDVDRAVSFVGQERTFFTQAKVDLLLQLFARELGGASGLRLLDVGCGDGALHRGLLAAGVAVTGVDVADAQVESARANTPGARYLTFDGRRLPFDDASFDAVIAVCVFHHVAHDEQPALAAEMRRVARVGGVVTIIEHNPLNPLTRIAVWRCPFDEDAILLPIRRTKFLLGGGEQVPKVLHFLFFPFRNRLTVAIEDKLRWLAFGAQYCAYATRQDNRTR